MGAGSLLGNRLLVKEKRLPLGLRAKTIGYLRREGQAGRRADFEKYLAAVPDASPVEGDHLK
jgi:hypothetical protein